MDLYYGIISIGTVSSFALLVSLKMSDDKWKKSFTITSLFSTGILILYNPFAAVLSSPYFVGTYFIVTAISEIYLGFTM